MSLRDSLDTVTKYGSRIVTVDPTTLRIEAVIKDGTVRQVSVFGTSPLFRWPKVGEAWMIRQENGYWVLDGIYQDEADKTQLTAVKEGDVLLNSGSGRVLLTTGTAVTRKYTQVVQSGSATEFAVEHDLNEYTIQVNAVNNKTHEPISITWKTVSANLIKVKFGVAPSEGAVVVVIG